MTLFKKFLAIKFLAMVFCLLMFISCKKERHVRIAPLKFDQNSLPVIAGNGQNYYGFLLDGHPVWGQNRDAQEEMIYCRYVEKDTSFYIHLNGENGGSLLIEINSVLKAGENYPLTDYNAHSDSKAIYYQIEPSNSVLNHAGYISTNEEPGYIKILQLDTQKRTVSGIFEFKARAQWGTRTMNISSGRFDVTYIPYRSIVL